LAQNTAQTSQLQNFYLEKTWLQIKLNIRLPKTDKIHSLTDFDNDSSKMTVPVSAASRLLSVSTGRPQTATVPHHPCEAPSLAPDSAVSPATT